MGAAISAVGVSRAFEDGSVALDGVSLDVAPGSVAVLVGPSGCGKTTLLRMIAGLDRPTRGTVTVDGAGAGDEGGPAAVAIAFQEPRLLPWRSTVRNVALPLELHGVPRRERLARAREMLGLVGLADAHRKLPGQLSGGMRMRAAIARALVTRPRVLLLDEPFGALDEITRHVLDDLVLSIRSELSMTVVLVTHSIAEAAYLGDRIFVMAPAPGRVVRTVEPGFAARGPALRASVPYASLMADLLQSLGTAMASSGGGRAA
ncbi:MAG: ABC transporter ATP-binding protein [Phycisphaerales bacterium]